MTDETTRDAKKSKKVDKRIGPTKYGKNPLKFDKVNERVLPKNKALSKTFFMLHHFLIKFINNESKVPPNFFKELKHKVSGYVLMLLLVTLPVILLGTKYVLDQMSTDQAKIDKGSETYHKRCAREAALAVAKNWNPGLTLEQQQAAVYKVADAVYDDSPCYNDSVVGRAIPGLDVKKSHKSTKIGSKFNPIKVTYTEVASKKTIGYTTSTKYLNRRYYYMYDGGTTWNPNWALWRSIDAVTSPGYRESRFDEINASERKKVNYILDHHDIYGMPSIAYNGHICKLYNGVYYPNDTYHSPACCSDHSRFVISALNTSSTLNNYSPTNIVSGSSYSNYSSTSSTYTVRIPSYDSGSVKISIESDQIKVETDSNIVNSSSTVAKAVPAECNVDIVLAIPVNGAANNADNRDAASDTAGTPVSDATATTSIPTSITNTPIYQMGQACKDFVKKFYHTRGVYMSLIPYSGKLSLSPDRASAWTTPIPTFNSSSTDIQMLIGSCLYGTKGTKDAKLTQSTKNYSSTPYYWGNVLTGCPIMCRRGTQYIGYGSNCYHGGLLLNTTTPNNSDYSYKYMRMNLNPCYIGYANTLAMKCEKQCTHYLPNPYYMIEPTADLVKIYEMCNALYPIYDTYNVSNFVFAALEWANNMFQSWTTDPGVSTTEGTGGSAVLARQSKTTSDRKKAVVLLINKPDWFEPGEMTYLGFNNDYSEVPVVESDKIDFSINYSDTSKAFLDGTAYNGTYRGQKQILTMEKQSGDDLTRTNGFYECGQGKYRLKFPQKGLIKLVVAPVFVKTASLNPPSDIRTFKNINDQYIVVSDRPYGRIYTSNNGIDWVIQSDICTASDGSGWNFILEYNAGNYIFCNYATGAVKVGSTLSNWTNGEDLGLTEARSGCSLSDRVVVMNGYTGTATLKYTTNGGQSWTLMSQNLENLRSKSNNLEGIVYGNGLLIAYNKNGWICRSYDKGETWTDPEQITNLSQLFRTNEHICGAVYADGKFCILSSTGGVSESFDGMNWSVAKWELGSVKSECLAYGSAGWVRVTRVGDVYRKQGTVAFTNISDGEVKSNTSYTITEKKSFYIESNQISDEQTEGMYEIDFNMSNIRLISAEITNRPYEKITPQCILTGNTQGPGTVYIQTNLKRKMTLDVKTKSFVTFANPNDLGETDITGATSSSGQLVVAGEPIQISGIETFTFPASCFAKKYVTSPILGSSNRVFSTKKLKFSFENANFESAVLKNQKLRIDGVRYASGNKLNYKDPSLTYSFHNGSDNTHWYITGDYRWKILKLGAYCIYSISNPWLKNIKISTRFSVRTNSDSVLDITYYTADGNAVTNQFVGSTTFTRTFPMAAINSNNRVIYYKHADTSNAGSYIRYLEVINIDNCIMNMNNTSDKTTGLYITDENMINFEGQGDLVITVRENEGNGIVQYKDAQEIDRNMEIHSDQTITIQPKTHYYEKQQDGTYLITLSVGRLKVENLRFKDDSTGFQYSQIRLPARSSVVDYSRVSGARPVYNSDLVQCTVGSSTVYDSNIGYWVAGKGGNNCWDMQMYSKNDFYFLTEEHNVGSPSILRNIWHGDGSSDSFQHRCTKYMSGLSRIIYKSSEYWPEFGFGLYGSVLGTHALMFEGFTQPINTILYEYGVGKNSSMATTDNYVNPTNDFNRTVLKQLTTEACAKLKNAKARVYVVKYKHQENWNEITRSTSLTYTNEATAHSYTEIENCATSSGGFVREASNESDLKAKLDEIATNIKSSGFANYQEATLK